MIKKKEREKEKKGGGGREKGIKKEKPIFILNNGSNKLGV
jgi:hypothetical protein